MRYTAPSNLALSFACLLAACTYSGTVPKAPELRVAVSAAPSASGAVAAAPKGGSESAASKFPLRVSENGRYLTTGDGAPFFWLADTAWLLLTKLTRQEAEQYLEDRRRKGFNVVQVMLIHDVAGAQNVYGHKALTGQDLAQPRVTPGRDPSDAEQYDYWDHVDYVVQLAASKGIALGFVPVWGSNVSQGLVSTDAAEAYGQWLADRYRKYDNVIWLNGGDVDAAPQLELWRQLGQILHKRNPAQLVTFHPRGRLSSADWFHDESWLAFNMFQSGHRTYEQDDTERQYGEDGWRYVEAAYSKLPTKPVLDGEPSYEHIPHGLHDEKQPRWTDADLRRYAYWSVFAGGCGFTYGHNSVMQFYVPGAKKGAFGATIPWQEALDAPGAAQMVHLRRLMLSRPYFERAPDQAIVAGSPGERYARLIATSGPGYALVYTYTGRSFQVNSGRLREQAPRASWFDPRSGEQTPVPLRQVEIGHFDPPGQEQHGNDWVLILDWQE